MVVIKNSVYGLFNNATRSSHYTGTPYHMQVQKVWFHLHVIIMSSPTERDG
jgi:hypothetical protein